MTRETKEKFDQLREKGHRITPQREQLLEFFYKSPDGHHFSAEELHQKLAESGIKISLATLYRSLKFLVENEFIRELDFGEDHKHYELSTPNRQHHHMICSVCNLTVEFEDKHLYEYAVKIAKEKNNFEIKDYQFKIFGLCEKCSSRRD